MNSSGNVLIYRLGSLGDTVIALPSFHKIRESFPNAKITLLTNKPVMAKAAAIEAVLGKEYFFDQVLAYPVGTRSLGLLINLIRQIRSHKIETMINLTAARSKKSALRDKFFFRLAGIKQFIGFPDAPEDFEVTRTPETSLGDWEANRLARRIAELGTIDLTLERNWDLRLTEEELSLASQAIQDINENDRIIAISIGTKCQSNDWGLENWISLLSHLSAILPQHKLVVVGAADEFEMAQSCLSAWKNGGLNLCGKMSPRVSAAVLKRASLFIGHDSGPIHLAACVGTPGVGIYSARNLPGQWFPRGKHNSVIYHKVDCAGCGLEVCIEQKKKCILSISVQEVISTVQQMIAINN